MLALVLLAWPLLGEPSRPLPIAVRASAVANFLYQLDCVADLPIQCARTDYGELWRRRFLTSAADSAAIVGWRAFRERYQGSIEIEGAGGPFPAGAAIFGSNEISLDAKVRVAGLQARSPEDYFERGDLLVVPGDRGWLRLPFRQFWGRWLGWWEAGPAAETAGYAARLQAIIDRPDLVALRAGFVTFFRSQFVENDTLGLFLLHRPDLLKSPSSGQQIDNYAIAEFLSTEPPEIRAPIILHELCHYLARQAPAKEVARLVAWLDSTGTPPARAARHLLNEALASALANGLAERALTTPAEFSETLARPMSFYSNDAIDRTAKALVGLVDTTLARGESMFDAGWREAYLQRIEAALGATVHAPRTDAIESFLFVDPAIGSYAVVRRAARRLGAASIYGQSESVATLKPSIFDEGKTRTSFLVVHPGQRIRVARLAGFPPATRRLLDRMSEGVVCLPRNGGLNTYVVVGADVAAVERQFARLAHLDVGCVGVLR